MLPSLSTSDLTYGCGIDGELILFEGLGGGVSPPRAQSAVTGIAPETLLQARTLLWDRPNRLIVSSRDLLFFDVEADGTLLLATNVSTPLSSSPSKFPGGGDAGINGLIRVTDVENNTLVVGAGMPGILVTALVASDQAAHPVSFGSLNVSAKGWLDAAYDIDSYQPKPSSGLLSEVASSPSSSQPPPPPPPGLELPVVSTVAVVVSAHQRNSNSVVGVIQLTNPATGAIQPPAEWTFLGGVDLPSEAGAARGCNRVRVHQRSRRAAFSCFGGGVGRDVVGFIDLTDVSHPNVTSVVCGARSRCPRDVYCCSVVVRTTFTSASFLPSLLRRSLQVPFVSQQPTGMLVVGDVLFVAGELDLMAFDMRNSTPAAFLSPPLLATCGTACRQVGNATGQNFHSLGYVVARATEDFKVTSPRTPPRARSRAHHVHACIYFPCGQV